MSHAKKDSIERSEPAALPALCSGDLFGVGARIRFTRTLTEPPSEEHPGRLYATKGEAGEVVGQNDGTWYQVKADDWPNVFWATRDEIEPLSSPNGSDEPRGGQS